MKKFVNIFSAIAICAAALLSSCIKEEAFVRETAELNVSLTRAGTTSVEQGDAIKDAWIWAFQCTLNDTTGAPTIDDDAVAVGARYVSGLSSYGNIAIHVPLPICDGSQDYLLVAVINTEAFGTLNLGAKSTWGTIKAATFSQTGAFWSTYPKDEDKTPEVMPISNWATFTVTSGNTHSSNCYNLNLPVYRAVAKAQFSVAKTDDFELEIIDVDVVANSGYTTGALLTASPESATGSNSEAIQRGKPAEDAATWWWASPTATTRAEGVTDPAVVYQLKNSEIGFVSPVSDNIAIVTEENHGANSTYTWVASTFLLENNNEAAYGEGAYDAAQGNGYNLRVQYRVEGDADVKTVYTPLGKVVRNHDYQVKALVEQSGALVDLSIEVVDWEQENINLNYENTVTIADNGYIAWEQLPDGNTIEGGKILSGQITMTANAGATAICKFALETPQFGTWHAELRSTMGISGNIAFFDALGNNLGVSTSGNISTEDGNPQQAQLIIKNVGNNFVGEGSTGDNVVELRIYATGVAGVYQIPNLPGVYNADGTTPTFAYYTLTQPRL